MQAHWIDWLVFGIYLATVFSFGIYMSRCEALPFMFYAGGLFLEELFGLPFAVSIVGIALFVGIYTTFGGLSAVVWTDVIQGVLMIAGGLIVTGLALAKIGGWTAFLEQVPEAHMHVRLPADHPKYPFPATMLGGYLMISIYYWCQNQTIVQRTLAARSEWDSRMGAIGAGYLKLLLPFILVLPGILAVVLIPDLGLEAEADKALPKLIELVVPTGLMGLVMAALIASLMSSADSSSHSALVERHWIFDYRFWAVLGIVLMVVEIWWLL